MKNYAATLLLCSLISLEDYQTMAIRFIEDPSEADFEPKMAAQQPAQSLAAVTVTTGEDKKEAKEEKKEGKAEGKEGKEGEGKEGEEEPIDPAILKARAEQELRDQTDAAMMEKQRLLKEIGVHDIDPKSPIYGHPVFKAAMVRALPYQVEQKELGQHWESGWHLVDNPSKDWEDKLDEQGEKAVEGYLPIKEDEDEKNYAKSIGRGPGWEIAKKHRDILTKQFKKEEAEREAAAAAAAEGEEGGEGKEGEAKEGEAKGEAKEEKKEEKKEAKALIQGDAEPTNFVVEPIADVKNYGGMQDFVGELGYTMAQKPNADGEVKTEVAPGMFITSHAGGY